MPRKLFPAVAVLLVISVGVVAARSGASQPQEETKDLAAARSVMDAQVAAWNRGDVAGFMESYAKEDSTTFVGAKGVTRGWQNVFDRYKTVYDTREKMGTLNFTDLEFPQLGDQTTSWGSRAGNHAPADKPHGRCTVLFRRTAVGWRIVYDHSSSES